MGASHGGSAQLLLRGGGTTAPTFGMGVSGLCRNLKASEEALPGA